MPGVLAGTTKDLMPPRPALLSTVAHTTTKPPSNARGAFAGRAEDLGAVQHPLFGRSSKSAVVSIAAASEPALRLGDRHRAPDRMAVAAERRQELAPSAPVVPAARPPSRRGPASACAGRGRVAPAELLGLDADLDEAVARRLGRRRLRPCAPRSTSSRPIRSGACAPRRRTCARSVASARGRSCGSGPSRASLFSVRSKRSAMSRTPAQADRGAEALRSSRSPRALRRCISGR